MPYLEENYVIYPFTFPLWRWSRDLNNHSYFFFFYNYNHSYFYMMDLINGEYYILSLLIINLSSSKLYKFSLGEKKVKFSRDDSFLSPHKFKRAN